ncbi:hypothetical protein C8F01DRAFT_467376 [Mycena amicta]|nr:hypothetical protein C8F01DRAFT_467376 [Mycena amicta]
MKQFKPSTVLLEVEDSDKVCQSTLHFQSATSTLVIVSADIVLAIRVSILYRKSHNPSWILFPLVCAEMICMLIVGYLSIRPLRDFVHVGSLVHGCYSMEVPRLLTYYSLPLLVVASIMFILTMYKCGTTIHALGFERTPLLELFLRDGVFCFFLAMLLCCITDINIVIWSPGSSGAGSNTHHLHNRIPLRRRHTDPDEHQERHGCGRWPIRIRGHCGSHHWLYGLPEGDSRDAYTV